MMNVQLKSRIIHFDFGHPYRRSAFAKIVSHPDVTGQKSVRGGLSGASCRGHRGTCPGVLFSRSSVRRHRGDGGAEERRDKHDWKRGVHECAANAVFPKRTDRSVGSEARPGRSGAEGRGSGGGGGGLGAGEAGGGGGASGTFSSKQPCLILFYKKGPYGAVSRKKFPRRP